MTEELDLKDLRRDFASTGLDESDLAESPFAQFRAWMDEALASGNIDPNAMTLSTVGADGRPSARVVLLKGFDAGGLVFFTNYGSKKGRDLEATPHAALNFFWPQLDRQVGVRGSVVRTSSAESEEYFRLRPVDSRLSAWASNQSSVVGSRAELEQRVEELRQKFGDDIPLPPFWGGFRLVPERFEFWQGRQNRLHDRIVYTFEHEAWAITRLAP